MSRLLLDTHVLLWWDMNDPRLSHAVSTIIKQTPEVYVSAVSALEIAIKRVIGKIQKGRDPHVVVADGGFEKLPITFEYAEAVSTLPPHHGDPFDRLLIATAKVEGLTIVTSDTQFAQYDVPIITAGRNRG